MGSEQRGKCSWTRENSLGCLPGTQQRQVLSPSPHPAMPSWPRVPGPQAGGSNSTHFLSFSEAEVCDQGAGGTGLPEPSASGLRMATLLLSLCLVPCVPWCFSQSQGHQLFRNSTHLLPHSDLTTSLETLQPQTGSFAFAHVSPFSP